MEFYLTQREISKIYEYQNDKSFYLVAATEFNDIHVQFHKEKEGKIKKENNRFDGVSYYRDNVLTIIDKDRNLYEGTVFETGTDKDDMQITGTNFYKIKTK